MESRGHFSRVNDMHCTSGKSAMPIPDVRKCGLEIFEEFEVAPVRFGQVVGFTLEFAGANRSNIIPNTVLVVERRRHYGRADVDEVLATHWLVMDDFWYQEWKRWHGFPIKTSHTIKLPETI